MKILFAAPENAWDGFLNMIRSELPEYRFDASGDFNLKSMKGYDVLIPTMCSVTSSMITESDRLRLIQQCGAGLEGVLSSEKIAGAGLDVFWEEPPDPSDPIFSYNVIATPHIGGVTDTSMNGIARGVAENIRRIAENKDPLNHFNF